MFSVKTRKFLSKTWLFHAIVTERPVGYLRQNVDICNSVIYTINIFNRIIILWESPGYWGKELWQRMPKVLKG